MKILNEKRIALIVIMLISVILCTIILKAIFNNQSIGATEIKEDIQAQIGRYIDYIPEKGTYSSLSKEYTGTESNSFDFETDMSLKWRIWSIDDEKITLIADKPVSVGGYKNVGGLYLANCNGYNNGVNIINEICNKCYSNKKYKAEARSLNIDDIENVLNKSIWKPEDYSKKSKVSYLQSKEYTSNLCYPYLYAVETGSTLDEVKVENGKRNREK